jgi:hypothetical protein
MENSKPNSNNEKVSSSSMKNDKGIENHIKAASHLRAAAENHLQAAMHHEDGDHAKAAQFTVLAHGHIGLANKAQKVDAKYHALNG